MLTKERVKRFRMVHMPSDVDLEGSGAEGRDGFFRRTTESPGGQGHEGSMTPANNADVRSLKQLEDVKIETESQENSEVIKFTNSRGSESRRSSLSKQKENT